MLNMEASLQGDKAKWIHPLEVNWQEQECSPVTKQITEKPHVGKINDLCENQIQATNTDFYGIFFLSIYFRPSVESSGTNDVKFLIEDR